MSGTTPRSRVMYPGSFDPLHLGHLDVIEQANELFGEVVVVVMYNFAKASGMFDVDERVDMASSATAHLDGVSVEKYSGLAIDALGVVGADFIVKGLRTPGDFEIEQQMAQMNRSVSGARTVYLPSCAELGFVSSRFVREIANYGGEVGHLVPAVVGEALSRRAASREQN